MPPKGSKKASTAALPRTLVLENGTCTIKAGIVSTASVDPSYDDCAVIPNCIARSTRYKRTYTASELAQCKDFGELAFRRPVEKGFIVMWETEKAIWEHEFTGADAGEGLGCTDASTLNAYHPYNSSSLSALPKECLLVIDNIILGHDYLPIYNGQLIQPAVRRLTETYLLNEIKEAVSFVAPSTQQFSKDLERTWKGRLGDKDGARSEYFKSKMRRGLQPLQEPREDLLRLGNERFAVPELLFNLTDIGIQEIGLPAAVMESVSILPEALKIGMLTNVLVVGGNSLISGFMERLEEDPIKHTWLGVARFASQPERLKEVLVSKAEYDERGSTWLVKKFAGGEK
ncbi:actin-like ATPase domain-containing protein [Zopfia rhizophila CBS 207.26]|uniref:Actin-like ATPase domain-containing protein n=1 Tax=Zopfia rhizophila CBS 207.26 TaxID=1314779 RepID=A0A6A6DY11_9PEZI|nr:actin-like ATPase domain-containing protein [Zopfia rhizophila CBS 207.26]